MAVSSCLVQSTSPHLWPSLFYPWAVWCVFFVGRYVGGRVEYMQMFMCAFVLTCLFVYLFIKRAQFLVSDWALTLCVRSSCRDTYSVNRRKTWCTLRSVFRDSKLDCRKVASTWNRRHWMPNYCCQQACRQGFCKVIHTSLRGLRVWYFKIWACAVCAVSSIVITHPLRTEHSLRTVCRNPNWSACWRS